MTTYDDDVKNHLRFCESQVQWLLETIEALTLLESPSTDKKAVDRCGVELHDRLCEIGAKVSQIPQSDVGNHLVAEFGEGRSQVLLLGHFDTVWPIGQLERMPIRHADGCLFGPGGYDMKAGIALSMLAVRALHKNVTSIGRRIVMLWTTDEEIGSETSRQAILDHADRSEAVVVMEPSLPNGALKTSRKGCGQFEMIVTGVAAHAGIEPGNGSSAIHEIARQVIELQSLEDNDRGVSVNVGLIQGGSRSIVVADEARASIDIRVPTQTDALQVQDFLRRLESKLAGTAVKVSGSFRPPLERSASVIRVYEMAQRVAVSLGRELSEGGTGGGSDGNLTAAHGIPTLDGLGAVGHGAHALHEHVLIDQLPWRAALIAGLIQHLEDGATIQ